MYRGYDAMNTPSMQQRKVQQVNAEAVSSVPGKRDDELICQDLTTTVGYNQHHKLTWRAALR